jgi:hypothetical protein
VHYETTGAHSLVQLSAAAGRSSFKILAADADNYTVIKPEIFEIQEICWRSRRSRRSSVKILMSWRSVLYYITIIGVRAVEIQEIQIQPEIISGVLVDYYCIVQQSAQQQEIRWSGRTSSHMGGSVLSNNIIKVIQKYKT